MPLSAGSRLGSYEVKFTLGVGGMGEVYCARDMKLDRDVALKVLPWSLADDPERLARFEREAKLLASLSHPHIAQLYHIEESPPTEPGQAPVRALVMELVGGPTLSERIRQGPLPVDEAVAIARQIAEALEMAHERGIIHRDLKPANVKLTGDGVVKVLDFGLAKALNPLLDLLDSAAVHTPSFAKPVTESGMVLGTAAYMAPERARGLVVDQRADIWALGVVLYEMLAGRRPFQGETTSDTLAAVLRQDVEYSQLPRDTPDEVRRLIRRCLQRDPKNRLRDAADARLILADVEHDLRTGSRSVGRWADRALWLLAGAATVALAVFALSAGRRGSEAASGNDASAPVVRFSIEPPPEVSNVTSVAVAADGRVAVYEAQVEGEYRFFIRRFDELASRAVPGTEGARGPFLSPDGISTAGGDALAVTNRSWRANAGHFEIGPERVVAPLAFGSGWIYSTPYDEAKDGRFLAIVRTDPPEPPRIRVVLGWDHELARLASPDRP